MADLKVNFAGIESPNPFWLASAPPTNTGEQIMRAYDQGWGGAVWKSLSEPIINVSRRLAGYPYGNRRLAGLSNIELSTDRSLEVNFKEIAEVIKRYPDHVTVPSLMAGARTEEDRIAWVDLVRRSEDTGATVIELNFGCPHGMPERGMGAAIGQHREYAVRCTEWVRDATKMVVLVKLTPNVADVGWVAEGVQEAGADGVTLINTVASIMGVDLDSFAPVPTVAGRSSHSGYCGPSVKPIALYKVSEVARACPDLPIGGIGGIETWRDAAEFILLGSTTCQVCTSVMHHGYRVIEDLCDGLSNYLDEHGMADIPALRGKALERLGAWEDLDLTWQVRAEVNQDTCIKCGKCHVACLDGGHQAISATQVPEGTEVEVDSEHCVGCGLCSLICPVHECITMVEQPRTEPPKTWKEMTSGE